MKHVFASLVIIALCVGVLPAGAASRPVALNQPVAPGFFGMNTYFTGLERLRNDGEDGIATLVAMGRGAGIGWAREELSWGNLERNGKGRWEWSLFDRRLLQMAEAGYGITGMLLTTPTWARVSDCAERQRRYALYGVTVANYWCPPADVRDFADYVSAVVERYDGDGYNDAPGSPRVAAWQIGNEPNHWETWPGSPAEYAALLRAGYSAAKNADPSAIVATGGLYVLDGSWSDGHGHSDGLAFLDAVIAADPAAWQAFDALAIHPFMPDVAPDEPGLLGKVTLWGRVVTARDWLATRTMSYGGIARPLWISEVGWSNCSFGEPDCYVGAALAAVGHEGAATPQEAAGPEVVLIGKSEQQQADYMVRAHAIALALGVAHLSYFQFEDKFDGSARNFWEEAAIVRPRRDGYQPRLAYNAYSVMLSQIGGATYQGTGPLHSAGYSPDEATAPALYHFRFLSRDNVLIDLIWSSQGERQVQMGLEPGRSAGLVSRDGAGSTLSADAAGQVALTIGEQPVYLRQSAPAALSVQPNQVVLMLEQGQPAPGITLSIGNRGSGLLSWSVVSSAAWLQPATTGGRGWADLLTLTLDTTALPLGSHTALLTITSPVGSRQVPVTVHVVPTIYRNFLPITIK